MKNRTIRFRILPTLITSLCMGFALQGCNATTGEVLQDSHSRNIDKKTVLELFNNGVSVDLHDLVRGYSTASVSYHDDKLGRKQWKQIKKPLQVIQAGFIRQSILKTSRGQSMNSCQFVAMRIELDGKIETAEWLATVKGKGKCNSHQEKAPRNYWVIQQSKNQAGVILHEGRAFHVQTTGTAEAKKVLWADIYTENSSNIRKTEVICYNQYEIQGGRYQLIDKRVEAYKPTGSMLNPHTPEMYWETVTDNADYQCPSL